MNFSVHFTFQQTLNRSENSERKIFFDKLSVKNLSRFDFKDWFYAREFNFWRETKLIEEYNVKLKAYEKEPENEKLFNKKRNDILYLLNKGKSSKPETIAKYKILLDEKTKKYY